MTTTPDLDQAREWPAGTVDKMNEWTESQLGFSLEPWQMDWLRQMEAPQPRTLKDMTPEEREVCQWMQADFGGEVVLLTKVGPDQVAFLHQSGTPGVRTSSWFHRITPLPDLRRMGWPEEQATEENPDQPSPEDVPEGETWIVECYGDRHVGTRDSQESPHWALARMDGTDVTFAGDHEVTLVSRLVPEVAE